jgi:hypothetical protein
MKQNYTRCRSLRQCLSVVCFPQAGNINQSLLTLGRVITALVGAQERHHVYKYWQQPNPVGSV